ncbi:MAG: discoidin domain-containing protein [Pseudonocardiales bacterium]|nr:discoidin domain-containing protein [Pseudonocardiales bacterium]
MPALAALVLVLGGGGVAAWATWAHRSASPAIPSPATQTNQPQATPVPPEQSDPPPTASALLRTATATASSHSARGYDANGKEFTYEPAKAIDGLAETAWRCDGNGVGQWLKIDFGRTVTLTSIGIIPGFAKTDPGDGTDRYAQNWRISEVQYSFDDGKTFRQTFNTSVSVRSPQTRDLPSISTSQVTITILKSVPGEVINGWRFDQAAISEVVVSP